MKHPHNNSIRSTNMTIAPRFSRTRGLTLQLQFREKSFDIGRDFHNRSRNVPGHNAPSPNQKLYISLTTKNLCHCRDLICG